MGVLLDTYYHRGHYLMVETEDEIYPIPIAHLARYCRKRTFFTVELESFITERLEHRQTQYRLSFQLWWQQLEWGEQLHWLQCFVTEKWQNYSIININVSLPLSKKAS